MVGIQINRALADSGWRQWYSATTSEQIRKLLLKRIDDQKQAVGMVVGAIEPKGRRVIAYGSLAREDARTLDGDTVFEIGSASKVFTSLLLGRGMNGVALRQAGQVRIHEPGG